MSNRINSLSIKLQTDTQYKDKLNIEIGKVIENFQKNTISALIKNKDLSGDPTAGTVEAKRFANATIQAYGDARGNHKGNKVKAKPVPVQIDDDKEFVEEVEEKDLLMYGIDGLIARRVSNINSAMNRYFERAFFNEAVNEGAVHTLQGADIESKLEELIQKVETTKNDFVDGVERDNIVLVLNPATYGLARKYIDSVPQGNVKTDIAEFGRFHGVLVFSSVYLPDTVEYLVLIDGAVAQPIRQSVYAPEKIQFSDATGFGLFLYAGTKAVTPDLIHFAGSLGTVNVTSVAGTAQGDSKITVTSAVGAGNTLAYKAHATAVASATYGEDAEEADYTAFESEDNIEFGANTKARFVEVDKAGRIIKTSAEITLTKKS